MISEKFQFVMEKSKKVSKFRINSPKKDKQWAEFQLFSEDRQPDSEYLLFPKVSSERQIIFLLAFLPPTYIVNNTFICQMPHTIRLVFWQSVMRTCLGWDMYVEEWKVIFYSNTIVYKQLPGRKKPNGKTKDTVEKTAQRVLDNRAAYQNPKKVKAYGLADLYDPNTMPLDLVKAPHRALDKAVDQCYRPQPFANETKRIEFLFERRSKYGGYFAGKKVMNQYRRANTRRLNTPIMQLSAKTTWFHSEGITPTIAPDFSFLNKGFVR